MVACRYNKQYLEEKIEELEIYAEVDLVKSIIQKYGDKIEHVDCQLPGSEFCIFHDPEACKNNPDLVREKFIRWLEEKEKEDSNEIVAIGFYLPEIDLSKREFKKDIIFSLTTFNDVSDVNFQEAIFMGKANFIGANFRGVANFTNASFKNEVYFQKAKFGTAYFKETSFERYVFFDETTFEGEVNFSNASFKGHAIFERVKFDAATFESASFEKDAIFEKASFEGSVNFSEVSFEGRANFYETKFAAAYFQETKFGEADFRMARFEGEADFSGTSFGGIADFTGASFERGAKFTETTFWKEANFCRARFKEKTSFTQAKFWKKVDFIRASFEKDVNFKWSIFGEEAYFREANFKGKTEFAEAVFMNAAIFDRANLIGQLYFKNLVQLNIFNPLKHSTYISLRNIQFSDYGQIIIDGCYIDHFSFINTFELADPRKVLIRNPKYISEGSEIELIDKILYFSKKELYKKISEDPTVLNRKDDPLINKRASKIDSSRIYKERRDELLLKGYGIAIKYFEDKYLTKINLPQIPRNFYETFKEALYEAFIFMKAVEEVTVDNVLSVYRSLRENFDYMLRYEDSGRLFVGEMNLKKEVAPRFEKIFYELYNCLASYGESILRPVLWMVGTIIAFAFLLPLESNSSISLERLGDALLDSVSTFFQLREIKGAFSLLERLLAIPILGSFVIALRRKLERRIRH